MHSVTLDPLATSGLLAESRSPLRWPSSSSSSSSSALSSSIPSSSSFLSEVVKFRRAYGARLLSQVAQGRSLAPLRSKDHLKAITECLKCQDQRPPLSAESSASASPLHEVSLRALIENSLFQIVTKTLFGPEVYTPELFEALKTISDSIIASTAAGNSSEEDCLLVPKANMSPSGQAAVELLVFSIRKVFGLPIEDNTPLVQSVRAATTTMATTTMTTTTTTSSSTTCTTAEQSLSEKRLSQPQQEAVLLLLFWDVMKDLLPLAFWVVTNVVAVQRNRLALEKEIFTIVERRCRNLRKSTMKIDNFTESDWAGFGGIESAIWETCRLYAHPITRRRVVRDTLMQVPYNTSQFYTLR